MLTHKVLCRSIRPGDWFVTIDLSDAYFHIAIYPAHRKFLRFAYQGRAYEYQAIPFGLSLAPRVFTRCVEAALSPLRNSGIRIFSYIDDYLVCSHSREQAVKRFHYGDNSSQGSGVQHKLGEEPSGTRAMYGVFGSQNKLPLLSRHAIGGETSVSGALPLPFPAEQSRAIQIMPAPAWPDGVSSVCGTLGAANDERFSALGGSITHVPTQSPQPEGENNASVHSSPSPVERHGDSRVRCPAWGGVIQGNHDNGRVLVRMGSDVVGENSEWHMEPEISPGSHKCLGAYGSVSGSETFPALSPRSSCFSENRQFHSGRIHQPPGRHSLTAATHVSSQGDFVEQCETAVSPSNTRAGRFKQRGRSPVTGESSVRRVDSPPTSGGTSLAEIRSSSRRSLRLAGKHTVSNVLLSVRRKCTAGCGRSSSPVAKRAALCISPPQSHLSHSGEGERAGPIVNPDSAAVAIQALVGGDNTAPGGRAMASPHTQRPPLPSGRGNLPPPPGPRSALGLARERWNLNASGLSEQVIDTIQSARAASTRSLYSGKWRVFEEWCERRDTIPFQCSVVDLLCFLQYLMDEGRAFSTIKVYLAAVSACHVGFGDKPAGQHPLVCRFMKGARRKLPVSRPLVPLWDLSVVLDALSHHPFEPMEAVGMKFVSLKTALLLALTTAKRVSDLQALSVQQTCLQFAPGLSRVCLRPNPAFVPKVVESAYRCPSVELRAFHPPPFCSEEERRLHMLCPVRALHMYVSRTAVFRKADQLFVSWATPHKGKPLSRQRLSHWIVEAISLAYECKGLQAPRGLRAHSTRGMATSWALFRGVSVAEICAAASWATPHTFVRFYRLDVSGPSLAQAVLEVTAPGLV
ncbi:uncharacterized protein LOC116677742 [Etheostoma spectabile]|uniref:uncharacterized protein LOC116677742 n=1 Tax=Etheostoma spectabile TaxID=54343 RepID=UPI0013AF535E|nr:uncharacterized protein LOC116677742 [Etheostoma spectabile]